MFWEQILIRTNISFIVKLISNQWTSERVSNEQWATSKVTHDSTPGQCRYTKLYRLQSHLRSVTLRSKCGLTKGLVKSLVYSVLLACLWLNLLEVSQNRLESGIAWLENSDDTQLLPIQLKATLWAMAGLLAQLRNHESIRDQWQFSVSHWQTITTMKVCANIVNEFGRVFYRLRVCRLFTAIIQFSNGLNNRNKILNTNAVFTASYLNDAERIY